MADSGVEIFVDGESKPWRPRDVDGAVARSVLLNQVSVMLMSVVVVVGVAMKTADDASDKDSFDGLYGGFGLAFAVAALAAGAVFAGLIVWGRRARRTGLIHSYGRACGTFNGVVATVAVVAALPFTMVGGQGLLAALFLLFPIAVMSGLNTVSCYDARMAEMETRAQNQAWAATFQALASAPDDEPRAQADSDPTPSS